MKQVRLVILSLLLLLVCATAKHGLSHRVRKSHRVSLKVEEEEVETPRQVRLLNPLRSTSSFSDDDEDDEENEPALGLRVVVVKNDQIDDNAKNSDYTELCVLKQGYVNLVTNYQTNHEQSPNLSADNTPILTIKRVFAVLNKQTLSIFENANVNSLVKTINVQQFGTVAVPRRWEKAHCFQVVNRNVHFDVDNIQSSIDVEEPQPEQNVLEAFCFDNEQKQEDWIIALRHFQNCDVRPVGNPLGQNAFNADIEAKVNTIKEAEEQQIAEVKDRALKELQHAQDEEDLQEKEQEEVEDELKTISDDLKIESAKEAKRRRNMLDEAKKIEEQTEKLEKERECLERMLRDREQEENNLVQSEIEEVEKDKEETLLRKAANVVIQVKQEESKKLEEQHEQFKAQQFRKQEQIKEDMVRKTLQAELDLPFDVCVDISEKNKQTTFQEICGQVTAQNPEDVDLATSCLSDKGFCQSCCELHIGLNFLTKRNSCQAQCQVAVDKTIKDDKSNLDCGKAEPTSIEQALEDGEEKPEGEDQTIDDAVAEQEETAVPEETEEAPAAESKRKLKQQKKHKKLHRRRRFLRKLRR